MMGYIAVGVCTLSLCIAAKERDEVSSNDICSGCFGAANNDCQNCTRRGDEQGEDS